jgi:hypothetical protein
MRQRVWLALIVMAMLFAAANMWTKHSAARQMRMIRALVPGTTSVIDSVTRTLPTRDDDWADPRIDLSGNEVDDAVSDYRVDMRGEMYERHAPDTALLRLSAPQL